MDRRKCPIREPAADQSLLLSWNPVLVSIIEKCHNIRNQVLQPKLAQQLYVCVSLNLVNLYSVLFHVTAAVMVLVCLLSVEAAPALRKEGNRGALKAGVKVLRKDIKTLLGYLVSWMSYLICLLYKQKQLWSAGVLSWKISTVVTENVSKH